MFLGYLEVEAEKSEVKPRSVGRGLDGVSE